MKHLVCIQGDIKHIQAINAVLRFAIARVVREAKTKDVLDDKPLFI